MYAVININLNNYEINFQWFLQLVSSPDQYTLAGVVGFDGLHQLALLAFFWKTVIFVNFLYGVHDFAASYKQEASDTQFGWGGFANDSLAIFSLFERVICFPYLLCTKDLYFLNNDLFWTLIFKSGSLQTFIGRFVKVFCFNISSIFFFHLQVFMNGLSNSDLFLYVFLDLPSFPLFFN